MNWPRDFISDIHLRISCIMTECCSPNITAVIIKKKKCNELVDGLGTYSTYMSLLSFWFQNNWLFSYTSLFYNATNSNHSFSINGDSINHILRSFWDCAFWDRHALITWITNPYAPNPRAVWGYVLILTCPVQVPWGLKCSQVMTFLLQISVVQRLTCTLIRSFRTPDRLPYLPMVKWYPY